MKLLLQQGQHLLRPNQVHRSSCMNNSFVHIHTLALWKSLCSSPLQCFHKALKEKENDWNFKLSHKKKDRKVWKYSTVPATIKWMLRTFQNWSLVLSRGDKIQSIKLTENIKRQLLSVLLCFYKITVSNCLLCDCPV